METENQDKHECCMKKSHEGHKENSIQKYLMVVLMAGILLMSLVQTFQINSLKNVNFQQNQITGNAVSGIDTTGWTEDEKMMYEHHGTLPARLQGNQQQSSSMVGGC